MELITIILTGLNAGFFFSWSVTVIPGTKVISDKAYLEVMQKVNRKILNPVFFVVFFGPAPLLIYLATDLEPTKIAAAIGFLIGPLGITMAKNVPLNDKLEAKDLNTLADQTKKEFRLNYEGEWNYWHYMRTAVSLISFVLVCL